MYTDVPNAMTRVLLTRFVNLPVFSSYIVYTNLLLNSLIYFNIFTLEY